MATSPRKLLQLADRKIKHFATKDAVPPSSVVLGMKTHTPIYGQLDAFQSLLASWVDEMNGQSASGGEEATSSSSSPSHRLATDWSSFLRQWLGPDRSDAIDRRLDPTQQSSIPITRSEAAEVLNTPRQLPVPPRAEPELFTAQHFSEECESIGNGTIGEKGFASEVERVVLTHLSRMVLTLANLVDVGNLSSHQASTMEPAHEPSSASPRSANVVDVAPPPTQAVGAVSVGRPPSAPTRGFQGRATKATPGHSSRGSSAGSSRSPRNVGGPTTSSTSSSPQTTLVKVNMGIANRVCRPNSAAVLGAKQGKSREITTAINRMASDSQAQAKTATQALIDHSPHRVTTSKVRETLDHGGVVPWRNDGASTPLGELNHNITPRGSADGPNNEEEFTTPRDSAEADDEKLLKSRYRTYTVRRPRTAAIPKDIRENPVSGVVASVGAIQGTRPSSLQGASPRSAPTSARPQRPQAVAPSSSMCRPGVYIESSHGKWSSGSAVFAKQSSGWTLADGERRTETVVQMPFQSSTSTTRPVRGNSASTAKPRVPYMASSDRAARLSELSASASSWAPHDDEKWIDSGVQ